jgi:exodeoxyribonuclease-5
MEAPSTTPTITLTNTQETAVAQVCEWYHKYAPIRRHFKLGGYAGTGKTTIIKSIIERLTDSIPTPNIQVVSFTGKAVSVLRNKGILSAVTLHSLIYIPIQNSDGTVTFERRDNLVNGNGRINLVIFDEASMCSKQLYEDLVSYEVPVLWVGDPGQLEPVGDDINLMHFESCDVILDEIVRQIAGSPIIRLATKLRKGVPILAYTEIDETLGAVRAVSKRSLIPANEAIIRTSADIIITAFNRERNKINREIREKRFSSHHPGILSVDEPIIITKNDLKQGIFNGMMLTVLSINNEPRGLRVTGLTQTNEKVSVLLRSRPECLYTKEEESAQRQQDYLTRKIKSTVPASWDYGYCLTCHKAQGSEWDNVMIYVPSWWGNKGEELFSPQRWCYTAVTRAKGSVFYAF